MVIKMTLGDNDFTELINTFCENVLFQRRYLDNPYTKDNSTEGLKKFKDFCIMIDNYNKILFKDFDELDKNSMEYVINTTKKLFSEYNSGHDLEVEVLDVISTKWQNGENVYYITQHSTESNPNIYLVF